MVRKIFFGVTCVFIFYIFSFPVVFGAELGNHYAKVDSNVRLKPWYNGTRIGYFSKGEPVMVTRVLGQWCQVEYKNYQNAYVYCLLLGTKGEMVTYYEELAEKLGYGHIFYEGKNYRLVFKKDMGTAYVDLKGNIIHYAYLTGEGPDDFKEGLTRYVENGKVGFINGKLEVIIPAQFDWASSFKNGVAQICNGCKKVYYGEHYTFKSQTWGAVNKKGVVKWNQE